VIVLLALLPGNANMIEARETPSAKYDRPGLSNTTDYSGAVFEWSG
jgi:hypothetical protein